MLDGVQVPACEGSILRVKGAGLGHARTYPVVSILKVTWQGENSYGADANLVY